MKKYILPIICMFVAIGSLHAANPKVAPYGWNIQNGELVYSLPTTQIAIDIAIEEVKFKAGEYARYGSKYLGVNCELADKSEFRVISGAVSLLDEKSLHTNTLSATPISSSEVSSYTPISQGGIQLSEERMAQQAAMRITTIRRQRDELISGDVGEGVFGAGLEAALNAMDSQERELLEMFIGKSTSSVKLRRLYIQADAEIQSYIVARFSPSKGIVPSSTIGAAPIYLQISPSKLANIVEAKANDKGEYAPSVRDYAIAAQCQCTLFIDQQSISESLLPIFEFGKVYKLNLPREYQIKHFGAEIK